REVPLHDASAHLHAIELALENTASASIPDDVRAAVLGYNRDDCRSTEALRDWLERLRAEQIARGHHVPRPAPLSGDPTEKVGDLERRQREARNRILADVAPEASSPEHPRHPYWLLAYLLDWHRREDKSQYWERYRLAEMSDEELMD